MTTLTRELLGTMATPCAGPRSGEGRVTVTTLNGVQIGIRGIGEGENRLTFRTSYLIAEALAQPHWIRFATKAEIEQGSKQWWRDTFKPHAFCHCDGTPAFENQPMGMCGETLTALSQPVQQESEEKPCIDVSEVPTPPTP